MSQFDNELEANEIRKKFEGLSKSPIGLRLADKLLNLVRSPKSVLEIGETIDELATAFREDKEARTTKESEHLLGAVVLMATRHDRTLDEVQERLGRLEEGIKVALRFPHDGSTATIERLAIVVVRGATDFASNSQEQTNEFLRIAAQITESEVVMLGRISEFQKGLALQAGHSVNQANWLTNVGSGWSSMNKWYPPALDEWMQRKSALVRLESYGFIERIPGNPTSEGSELGQSPYALLPLGQDFYEYIKPI